MALLLYAPSVDNHSYQQQMQLFNQHQNGFTDRDLVLVQVLATDKSYAKGQLIDEYSAVKLRNRFGVGVDKENFRVILVGKDGGIKRQDTKPVKATAIFEQIDAMLMRQQEMRSSRQKVAIKYKRVKAAPEGARLTLKNTSEEWENRQSSNSNLRESICGYFNAFFLPSSIALQSKLKLVS